VAVSKWGDERVRASGWGDERSGRWNVDQRYVKAEGQKCQIRREIHVFRLRKRTNTPNVMEIKKSMF
jgi:hypothetical protein